MKRWKITIEYNGAPFVGWQAQDNQLSVQGAIETAIEKFCGQFIRIQAAGRTDTGVHARGQVAHFDLDYGDRKLEGFELAKAINAHLRPHPVTVLHAEEVDPEFNARFSTKNKLYRYRIINRWTPLAIDEGFAWHFKRPLDAEAMHDAAQVLIGHHDFTSFRDSECQAKTPMRTLDRLDITRHGDEVILETEGKSFLHHQVRNMVGTLSLVGEGKWAKSDIKTVLDARDRTKAGITAPACGLYLMRIDY